MYILGIDPGLTNTGWGIIKSYKKELRYIDHGIIKSNTSIAIEQRLLNIFNELNHVIIKYKPQVASIENVFVNMRNPMSALKLGYARGVAILALSENGIAFHESSPNMIKKHITGHGHANKSDIKNIVRKKLHVPINIKLSNDASDALSIAIEIAMRHHD